MAEYLGVEYIYHEDGELSASDPANSNFLLNPASLKIMSSEWLIQLEAAAAELDEKAIAKLLDQISDEHSLFLSKTIV